MYLAKHPAVSPWFRSSLLEEMSLDELHRMEPADGRLIGIADKNRRYYRATIQRPDQPASWATGHTAAEATRNAQRLLLEETAA